MNKTKIKMPETILHSCPLPLTRDAPLDGPRTGGVALRLAKHQLLGGETLWSARASAGEDEAKMPVSREELEARRTKIIHIYMQTKTGSITAPTSGKAPPESFAITDGRSRRNARVTPVVKRLDPGFAAAVSRVTARDGTGRAATLEPQPMVKKSVSALRGVGHARLALRSLAPDDSTSRLL